MKKYITYILFFFVAVVAIDQAVGLVGDYMQHHAKRGETQQFDNLLLNDNHDVLIMGSSRAHHHYVPQILEDSLHCDVYNAGVDGEGIILFYGMLQIITERYTPKMIVYDIEPAFDIFKYEKDNQCVRYLSELKPYYRRDSILTIFKDVSPKEYYKVHSGICRYNSRLLDLLKSNLSDGYYYEKGYLPLKKTMATDRKRIVNNDDVNELDSVKIMYLKNFVKLCKSQEIPLVLVLSPKWGDLSPRMLSILQSICDENNVELINNNDLIDEPEFFAEPMHLNNDGAEVYSREFAEHFVSIKN